MYTSAANPGRGGEEEPAANFGVILISFGVNQEAERTTRVVKSLFFFNQK